MFRLKQKLFILIIYVGLLLCGFKAFAFDFEPGVGAGLEYTNNAALSANNQQHDVIAIGYLGAKLEQSDGPVLADITATLNHHRYTQDTFKDQRYFNLGAFTSWEMVRNRFTWQLQDFYSQRPINSTDPNTPDNIQDSNVFTFGANIVFPTSARQTFTLTPEYRNFYYEVQLTDNQQYSLLASWAYKKNSLTSIGFSATARLVDYNEPLIDDVVFGSVYFTLSNQRASSDIVTNLGSTYVERENGQNTTEFAGNLNWLVNLTSHSRMRTYIGTDLTDSSEGQLNFLVDPEVGDPDAIQITTDVIRNQVVSIGYYRQDGTLASSLSAELRKLNYSESPDDRRIWNVSGQLNYPLTALMRSGLYARYNDVDYLDSGRMDTDTIIGGNIGYQLSRNLKSSFDIRYRKRNSTVELQNFDEWSAYISLVYGFGQPLRPTRLGGF